MDFETCFRQSRYLLLEGVLGERLKREYGLKIDGPAAIAPLITQPAGRAALRELWGQYRAVARRHRLPFLATTPTRRANRERTALAGYDAQLLRESVAFLREVREQTGGTEGMYIGALMGCRGDAHLGDAVLPSAQAKEFHSWAVDIFAEAGAEFLYAGIMPALPEAIGMAQAMEQTGLPYIISFMIRKNGRLIDGTPISQAIAAVDASVDRPPLCFYDKLCAPRPAAPGTASTGKQGKAGAGALFGNSGKRLAAFPRGAGWRAAAVLLGRAGAGRTGGGAGGYSTL